MPIHKARPLAVSPKEVGARIKRLRLALGLSQRQVGDVGTTYAYLSRIEAGDRTPSYEALIQIASKLKTTGLELLTGNKRHDCPFCGRSGPKG